MHSLFLSHIGELRFVVPNWSDTKIHRLCEAVSEQVIQSLVCGCHVHRTANLWQQIRDRVSCSKNKTADGMRECALALKFSTVSRFLKNCWEL